MKIINKVNIALFGLAIASISGCSTISTLKLEDYSGSRDGAVSARTSQFGKLHNEYACKDPSTFVSIPYVYSGAKKAILNLTQPLHCGLSTGEMSLINNFMYLLFYPVMLVDLPLSFVADTVALPYTIPKQYKEGDIIDPPYMRIADKYARRNDNYRYVHSPLTPYDEDMIADYYEKGMKTLHKYFGDMSYADMDTHLGVGGELDHAVLWLAQYYQKKGDFDKSRYYSAKHLEIDGKYRTRSEPLNTAPR